MKTPWKFLLSSTAASLLAAIALASDPMTEHLRKLSDADFDRAFVKQMVEHHKQGIEMADLAASRAQDASVKAFAEKTRESQEKELKELKGMRSASQKNAEHDQHHDSHRASTDATNTHLSTGDEHQAMQRQTMSKLESARGADFDRAFVEEMTKHHQMAIEMNELARNRAANRELRAFAEKSVSSQQQEIAELQQLKR